MLDLTSYKTTEECLKSHATWIGAPERTIGDISALIDSISEKTGDSIPLIECALESAARQALSIFIGKGGAAFRFFGWGGADNIDYR